VSPDDTELLLLDEMFAPLIAQRLRDEGFDVVSVAEGAHLRSSSDAAVFAWACEERRRVVTENVQHFDPLLAAVVRAGEPTAGVLFTSSRTFRRSRKNPGPLLDALRAWLLDANREAQLVEWLAPAPDGAS
jgi:hypothetical protein